MLKKYAFIFLSVCWLGCRPAYVTTAKPTAGTKVQNTPVDKKLEKEIAPYRASLQKQLSEEVVYSPIPMEKGLPESELTNVIADAVFTSAKAWSAENEKPFPDMCLLNNGGIRTALPAGMLNLGHMYEVMPFENEIVLLKLTPEKFRGLVNYVADKGGSPVAGIRMKINGNVAEQVEINGQPFLFDKDVWVATSDFLAYGGDGMNFFDQPLAYFETRIKVRDAITNYFRSFHAMGKPLDAVKDGRIYK